MSKKRYGFLNWLRSWKKMSVKFGYRRKPFIPKEFNKKVHEKHNYDA